MWFVATVARGTIITCSVSVPCSKKAALYKDIKIGCNLPLGLLKITEAEVDVLLPDRLSQRVET